MKTPLISFWSIRCVIMLLIKRREVDCQKRRRKYQLSAGSHFHFCRCFLSQSFTRYFLQIFVLGFRSTSLSIVADSPSVYHFSSHMGQLMRHSADSLGGPIQGCAMLWPHCPYSSDKLMRISTKVKLRWPKSPHYFWLVPSSHSHVCLIKMNL